MGTKATQTGDLDEFMELEKGEADPQPAKWKDYPSRKKGKKKDSPVEQAIVEIIPKAVSLAEFPLRPRLVAEKEIDADKLVAAADISTAGTDLMNYVPWKTLKPGDEVEARIAGTVVRVVFPWNGRPETGMLILRVPGAGLLALHPEVDGTCMKLL